MTVGTSIPLRKGKCVYFEKDPERAGRAEQSTRRDQGVGGIFLRQKQQFGRNFPGGIGRSCSQ